MKRAWIVVAIAVMLLGFGKKEKKWVAIGDSITYLNDHPDETGHRVSKGYMTQVQEQLPRFRYINKGYNGWTAGNIAERFDSLYIPVADVYTVFLGTNDWWQGRPVGTPGDYINATGNHTIYSSFRIIINKIKALNKKAKIVLITPMQRADFVYLFDMKNNAWGSYKEKNGQNLGQVVEAVKTIGKMAGCTIIDLYNDPELAAAKLVRFKRLRDPATGRYRNYGYPYFQEIPFNPETDEYPYPADAIGLTYDGLHPSDEGSRIIAGKLIGIFRKL